MVNTAYLEGIKKGRISRRDIETTRSKFIILHNAVRFLYNSYKYIFDNFDTVVCDVFYKSEEIIVLV